MIVGLRDPVVLNVGSNNEFKKVGVSGDGCAVTNQLSDPATWTLDAAEDVVGKPRVARLNCKKDCEIDIPGVVTKSTEMIHGE